MKLCMYVVNKLYVLFICEAIRINFFVIKMYFNGFVFIIYRGLVGKNRLYWYIIFFFICIMIKKMDLLN